MVSKTSQYMPNILTDYSKRARETPSLRTVQESLIDYNQ